MKSFVKTALLLSVIATPLMASGSLVPRPVPAIASYISQGGLAPVDLTKPQGIEVLANGLVVKVEKGVRTKTLAQLSSDVTQALVEQIDAVQSGDLVDTDAGKPMCMDAPVTTETVTKTNGESIAIARFAGCHRYDLQNGSDTYLIKEALEGLRKLGYLTK